MTFKTHFEIPEGLIYLNTPGNGLMPKSHYTWRNQREQDFFKPEGFLRDEQPLFIREGKQELADFFHCTLDEVFCTPSFTWAFKTFLSGIPKNYSFLLLDEDYPSVNYPVISSGFDYFLLPQSDNLEESIYEYVQVYRPNILAISIVQYITGLKIDLAFIQQLKKDFPSLIIIGDGTQYFGTENFNLTNSGFDVVGSSGYKWLMAGFGNGFILIKKDIQHLLFEVAQHRPRPKEAFYEGKSILAVQYETGHLDSLSNGTLQQSLLFLKNLSMDKIEEHIQWVSNFAYEEFDARNLLLPQIKARKSKSPLINLQIDPAMYPELVAAGIRCFPRGTGIRIGIHLYNDREDIVKLLEFIDQKIK